MVFISSQRIAKLASLDHHITMAKSSGEDFDQDLPFAGLYQVFILDGQGLVGFIKDGHFEGLWKSGSHIDD